MNMKLTNDRERYFEKYWDRLIDQPHDEYRLNLEEALDTEVRPMVCVLSDEQIALVKKAYAPSIAEKAEKVLHKMRALIESVDSGEASLGYTTVNQEWSARRELGERYEFNCYQLRVFKGKYGL